MKGREKKKTHSKNRRKKRRTKRVDNWNERKKEKKGTVRIEGKKEEETSR